MDVKAESLELRAESPCPERAIVLVVIVCALMHLAVVAFVCWAFANSRSVTFPLMPRAAQLTEFRGVVPADMKTGVVVKAPAGVVTFARRDSDC